MNDAVYANQGDFVVTVTQDFGPDTKALELPHFSAAIVKWDVVESSPEEYYDDDIYIDDDDASEIVLTMQYRINRAVSKEIQQAYPISDDTDTVVTIACKFNGETQFSHVFRGDLHFTITMAADKHSDEPFLLTAKLFASSANINSIEDL